MLYIALVRSLSKHPTEEEVVFQKNGKKNVGGGFC